MGKLAASSSLVLGASMFAAARTKHDDGADVTTPNDRWATDESVDPKWASSDLSVAAPIANTGDGSGAGASAPGNTL